MAPRYEIRLHARSDLGDADPFPGLDIRTHGRVLLLRGELDQAALHGLLERVRLLHLDLLDVRRCRSAPRGRQP